MAQASLASVEGATAGYWFLKRTIDIVFAGAMLVCVSPLLALVALAIWREDPGAPILFRQQRTGLGGRRFTLLKFRTMVRDAEALKEALRHQSAVAWPDFRLEQDPRVTRVGRFLRTTSLDELPQLWNVVRGDMTLVGPRPTSFEAGTYELWQTGRLEYRPGITGPWQVHGRSSMDFDERCRLEISFFRNPSIWRELRLLFATAGVVFKRTGVA
jgi:lipopolysaccharide/colanic/teichoic acid biosynthesis glycosyltransferase